MFAKCGLLIAALIQTSFPLPAFAAGQSDSVVVTGGRPRGPEQASAAYRFKCKGGQTYTFEFAIKTQRKLVLISATPVDEAGIDRLKAALAGMGRVDVVSADCSAAGPSLSLLLIQYPEGGNPTVRTWSPDPRHMSVGAERSR